jgi:membrane-bound ClpP family serine protease
MLEWVAVISLILVGIALLIAEIILIPGATVVGVLGLLFMGGGLYLGFINFGTVTGYYILGTTVATSLLAVYLSFKNRLWERFALKSINEGKVNRSEELALKVGETGTSLSSMRPFGKAEFGNIICEVKSLDAYIPPGKQIRIIKIESNKIFVEPVN